ncbi:MAG TPA: response regulator, partial [Nitrospiraceae bacterium]|nr:response regulator [Nitrospiraceae bacterium]
MGKSGGHTILNVHGDEKVLRERSDILTGTGCRVLDAGTGEEALRLGAMHKPDLIVMNVMLPDTSGAELCRLLKSNQATASVPILLVSAGKAGGGKAESVVPETDATSSPGANGSYKYPSVPGTTLSALPPPALPAETSKIGTEAV